MNRAKGGEREEGGSCPWRMWGMEKGKEGEKRGLPLLAPLPSPQLLSITFWRAGSLPCSCHPKYQMFLSRLHKVVVSLSLGSLLPWGEAGGQRSGGGRGGMGPGGDEEGKERGRQSGQSLPPLSWLPPTPRASAEIPRRAWE